jgi:hypothetical protein
VGAPYRPFTTTGVAEFGRRVIAELSVLVVAPTFRDVDRDKRTRVRLTGSDRDPVRQVAHGGRNRCVSVGAVAQLADVLARQHSGWPVTAIVQA